MSTLFILFME